MNVKRIIRIVFSVSLGNLKKLCERRVCKNLDDLCHSYFHSVFLHFSGSAAAFFNTKSRWIPTIEVTRGTHTIAICCLTEWQHCQMCVIAPSNKLHKSRLEVPNLGPLWHYPIITVQRCRSGYGYEIYVLKFLGILKRLKLDGNDFKIFV